MQQSPAFDAQKNFNLSNMLFTEMQKYLNAYRTGAYSESKRGQLRAAYKVDKKPKQTEMIGECFGFKFSPDSAHARQ